MLGPKPGAQGFDYWFAVDNNAVPSHKDPTNFERNGVMVGALEGYSCDLVVDEAIDWLQDFHQESKPFFLNVWFNEPHAKIASPPELVEKYASFGADAEYMANITNMDEAIGKLLQYLDDAGLSKNTLIMFTSDNGPYRQASTGSFRGKKSYLYEGGIREPGIFRWPQKIAAATETKVAAGFVDLMPTIASIAGGEIPNDRTIDGENILPLLLGETYQREKPLYWFFYKRYPISALRKGDYVIMGNTKDVYKSPSHPFDSLDQVFFKNAKLEEFQVYNLRNDPGQKQDLYLTHSDEFQSLKSELLRYHQNVVMDGPEWSGLSSK